MSSDYYAICLNHDPALELAYEWATYGEARDAIAGRDAADPVIVGHPGCDLLIARHSGALVEIGCPPSEICRYHRDIVWVEVGWLRLYFAALNMIDTGWMRLPQCWSPTRVKRLGSLLEIR